MKENTLCFMESETPIMKTYTQEEFDALPVENGVKICPTGDYSAIRSFSDGCHFVKNCIFGGFHIFGEHCLFCKNCIFGNNCRFGEGCIFSSDCCFDKNCSFGNDCCFGGRCIFSECCIFSEHCIFGDNCIFGGYCSFGERCHFSDGCSHEGLTNSKYFACDRIGSEKRKTYFFVANEGYYVRAGCYFGTFEEFEERVERIYKGTVHEKEYLLALKLARLVLDGSEEELT